MSNKTPIRWIKIPKDDFEKKIKEVFVEAMRNGETRSVSVEGLGYKRTLTYDPQNHVVEYRFLYCVTLGKIMSILEVVLMPEDLLALDWDKISSNILRKFADKGLVSLSIRVTDRIWDEKDTMEFAKHFKSEFSRKIFIEGARIVDINAKFRRENIENLQDLLNFISEASNMVFDILYEIPNEIAPSEKEITVKIPPEYEELLDEITSMGLFKDSNEAIGYAIRLLALHLGIPIHSRMKHSWLKIPKHIALTMRKYAEKHIRRHNLGFATVDIYKTLITRFKKKAKIEVIKFDEIPRKEKYMLLAEDRENNHYICFIESEKELKDALLELQRVLLRVQVTRGRQKLES